MCQKKPPHNKYQQNDKGKKRQTNKKKFLDETNEI